MYVAACGFSFVKRLDNNGSQCNIKAIRHSMSLTEISTSKNGM